MHSFTHSNLPSVFFITVNILYVYRPAFGNCFYPLYIIEGYVTAVRIRILPKWSPSPRTDGSCLTRGPEMRSTPVVAKHSVDLSRLVRSTLFLNNLIKRRRSGLSTPPVNFIIIQCRWGVSNLDTIPRPLCSDTYTLIRILSNSILQCSDLTQVHASLYIQIPSQVHGTYSITSVPDGFLLRR